jgi:hypothetical protein
MRKFYYCIFILSFIHWMPNEVQAQSNKGINFQAIARNNSGYIIPNKLLTIRVSIKADTASTKNEYQEIVPVTTNALGLFTIVVGQYETNKTVTMGPFENINWSKAEKYLQIEIDTLGDLSFINMGAQKINYVPFSFYADNVGAQNINGIIGVSQGGTGLDNLTDLKAFLSIDKIDNTPDSLKPTSTLVTTALTKKLNTLDTLKLSARINLKLNSADTLSLSNRIKLIAKTDTSFLSARIDSKLNKVDTASLSNRINKKINIGDVAATDIISALGYAPIRDDYGSFYDTAAQPALVSTATALKFPFIGFSNNIIVNNNSALAPTKITVLHAGIYNVKYAIQMLKNDVGADIASVWIRRNGSAYLNTNVNFNITGSGIKNMLTGAYYVELGSNDYVELYYSIKNSNTIATGSITQLTPSRPATPSVLLTIDRIN